MGPFQLWFERAVSQAPVVRAFMQTAWGWPAVESVHFLGLTLLFGSIVVWDLRLLGMARSVPIAAFHRLVPLAVLGFAINVASGSLFVMAEANQYVYNPAFQLKVLLLGLPMHAAVGTSLLVIAFNSVAGVVGYLDQATLAWRTMAGFTALAIVGVVLGSRLAARVEASRLRRGFAIFILVMAAFILAQTLLSGAG